MGGKVWFGFGFVGWRRCLFVRRRRFDYGRVRDCICVVEIWVWMLGFVKVLVLLWNVGIGWFDCVVSVLGSWLLVDLWRVWMVIFVWFCLCYCWNCVLLMWKEIYCILDFIFLFFVLWYLRFEKFLYRINVIEVEEYLWLLFFWFLN